MQPSLAVLMLCAAAFATGCAPASDPDGIPAGAIDVGNDTYMVPVDGDAECQMYRAWSETKLVAQVIYYRRTGGEFTMSRDEACPRG